MKQINLVISLLISAVFLSACSNSPSQQEVEQAQAEKRSARVTIVSSGKPQDVLPAFKTFTWNSQYSRVLSAVNQNDAQLLKSHIQQQLINYLSTKGYVYQSDPSKADIVIGFLFALEDDIADATIQDKFGLLPGLNEQGMQKVQYEKGTLLLAALDNELKQVYWRSALQGFVDMEDEINDQGGERMQAILHMMLGGFPAAGR